MVISVCDLLASSFTENLISFDAENGNNIIKVSDLYLLLFKHPVIAYINKDAVDYYGVDVQLKYYTTENLSIVITSDPDLIVVKEAVFSKFHGCYIPKESAVFSQYMSDYLYRQDSVYSKFLQSWIFSRDAKMVWNQETQSYDWAPPELSIEIHQNGHYRTLIRDQVYKKGDTWYYTNGEIVW